MAGSRGDHPNDGVLYDKQNILSIYDESYSNDYEKYYLSPWKNKHELNISNIERLLQGHSKVNKQWLDICCGQGWHFSKFPTTIEKTGVDLSLAQLRLARQRTPDAVFIHADVMDVTLKSNHFDIVTSFWAAYCYLNSERLIRRFINKAINWARKGGAIYFEVLLPEDLESFNRSEYARQTGFCVIPRTSDFSEWTFRDVGGDHNMTSPPIVVFTELLSEHFNDVEAEHDSGFMTHVIATGKK